MDWNATALGIDNGRTTLLELVANRHHRVGLIGGACGGCWKSEFTNRRFKLLARDAVCQDAQLRKLTDFALIIICGRCLIPLRGYERAAHRSTDGLVIHVG